MDIGYAGALIGGVLTLLSPCSVLLLPAFFAYAFSTPTKLLARTGLFYLGLITTLVPIGVLAGTLGAFLTQNRAGFVAVAASLVIALGLVQLIGIRLPAFARGGGGEGTSSASVFLLGSVYGVAGVCAGPILGSVLTVAAVGGNAAYGGILLAIYALGMTVPLFVLALVWNRLRIAERGWLRPRMVRIGRWQNSWLLVVSGLLSIGIGALLLLTEGTAGLGGILTIGEQFAAESFVLNASSGVSNLVFGLAAIVALIIIAVIFFVRGRQPAAPARATEQAEPGRSAEPIAR
ncbi:cytochrome c biogenesis CcdA family protein [Cryobacterium sp. TMT2-23]|uniref:cytochrome c biogenesis CcdA family protein n=1 Tax=Cryobacterium sp. TMT2-23 TaxID=1259252 RepID=UPI0010690A31|nr:cytochrome c biogenesis CcdA family protein [Cryobacterium sp. TMT2-23]TFD18538.1 cytochrome c biogenesis protein CcdA [Cryobacterium sp. TMT2-23]